MVSSKSLPSGVLGLVLVRGVGELAAAAMLPFVVLWAHQQAGLHGPAAGVLFVVQAAGEVAAGLLIGSLADRLGRRRVLVASAAGMAVGYGFLAVVDSPVPAIALFLLAGVFESAFHPVIGALVGDLVPERDLRRAFGLIRVGTNLGRVLGPLLGALLILLSLRAVFFAAGALLLVVTLVAAVAIPRREQHDDEEDDSELPPGTLRALVRDPGLSVLVLAAGFLAIAFTWFEADGLVILRRQAPLSAEGFAVLFAVSATTVILTQIPITRITQAISTRAAILIGTTVQGAGLALLILSPLGYPVLVISVVVTAIGEAVAVPALGEIITIRAGSERRTSYQAALSLSQDLGTALGPTSGLALAQTLGPSAVWTIGALLSVASGTVSSSVLRPTKQAPDDSPAPRVM